MHSGFLSQIRQAPQHVSQDIYPLPLGDKHNAVHGCGLVNHALQETHQLDKLWECNGSCVMISLQGIDSQRELTNPAYEMKVSVVC